MTGTGDESMPPRPECEFDFNFPTAVDDSDSKTLETTMARHSRDAPTQHVPQAHTELDALLEGGSDNAQQVVNYDNLKPGFFEDGDSVEQHDRSREAEQAHKSSPNQKKSPRRSEEGDEFDKASPNTKRPRTSLFGGPTQHVQDEDFKDSSSSTSLYMSAQRVSTPNFHRQMSDLNLEQQPVEDLPHHQDATGLQDAQDLPEDDGRPTKPGFDPASFGYNNPSPATSRAVSEDDLIIPPDDQPAYELRRNIDRSKAYTFIDTDNTGNYDPDREARLEALRLRKSKAAKAAKKKGKGKAKIQNEHIPKRILKLRFETFGNVRNIMNDEENWPNGWSEEDTEYEQEAKDYRDYHRRKTPNIDMQIPIEDPLKLFDDVTGYPFARGCKQCRLDDKDCPMVGSGTFPCKECMEEDVHCEPIMEPAIKDHCKQCEVDDEEHCSFKDDPDQAVCDRCSDHGFVCVPLPPQNSKAPRISIEEIMYGPDRRHIQCTSCRIQKKRCSLKKKTDKPPCRNCKKNGIGCTFFDVPKVVTDRKAAAARKKKKKKKKNGALGHTEGAAPSVSKPDLELFSREDLEDMYREDEENLSREDTPEIEMEDYDGNKGMLTKIKTSFAHPIRFNVSVDYGTDCSFCSMPVFGFIGSFEREVHVIKWYDGLGHTELGGGHCEDKGPTVMCTDCTMARVQINLCENHEFECCFQDDDIQHYEIIAEDLVSEQCGSGDVRYQLQRWCSLCFSVAKWGCATRQLALTGGADDDEERVGCGLRLCGKCLETLRDNYGWSLDDMATAMAMLPKATENDGRDDALEGKPRADVEYLSTEGLLMRTVCAESDGF
ncbi:hypothetical protein ACEQ8H_005904 [Pleosporales sp. CAS-2024a]